MERSSCSSDVPFVAATCFRRSTTSSSMFLIMTCAMIHRNRIDSGHAITMVGDSNDNRRFRQVSRQILSGGIDQESARNRGTACCTEEEEAKEPPFPAVDHAART